MTDVTFFDRKQAAKHLTDRGLKTAPSTLSKLATVGGGPLFRRYGVRVVYMIDDLNAWAESKLSSPLRSTSDHPEVVS